MEEKNTTIYFVRHAAINLKDGEAVEEDPPLNKKGIRQAQILAEQFKKIDPKIDVIIASSMKRSIETAKVICNELEKNYKIIPEFNEFSRRVFKRNFWEKIFWVHYFKYRGACKKFDKIIQNNKGKKILFVIHGNVIRGLLGYKLGLSLKKINYFSYNNANISRLTFKGKKLNTVSYFNSKVLF